MGNWIKSQTTDANEERPKVIAKEQELKSDSNFTPIEDPEIFEAKRRLYKSQYIKKRTILIPNQDSLKLQFSNQLDETGKRNKKSKEWQNKKNAKSPSKNNDKVTMLLEEWSKDKLRIWYEHWLNLLNVWEKEDLLNVRDQYLNESVLHFCCTRSHLHLFEKLLTLQPELVNCKDIDGNTPFHSLWRNTISNECELISMFNFLNSWKINVFDVNKKSITGLDILEFRVIDSNPYDNIQSVKLFYQYIYKSFPEDIQKQLKNSYKMWNSEKKEFKCRKRKLTEYNRRSFSDSKFERRKRGKTTVGTKNNLINIKSKSFNPIKIVDEEKQLKSIRR